MRITIMSFASSQSSARHKLLHNLSWKK